MALTFPRNMTAGRCWHQADFQIHEIQELAREASGAIQGRDLADPIWRIEFQSVQLDGYAADDLLADFETLGGVLRSFYASPFLRPAPRTRLAEALTGVSVNTIRADRRALRLTGLPASFEMSAGDFVSIATATGKALHRLARGGVADGAGLSPELELSNFLRPDVAVAQAVTLIDPPAEFRLLPGSLRKVPAGPRRWRVSFSAVEDPS